MLRRTTFAIIPSGRKWCLWNQIGNTKFLRSAEWTGIINLKSQRAGFVTVSCMRTLTPHGTSGREVLCLLHFHSTCPMQISFVAWQRVLLTLYQIRSGSIICALVKQSVYCRPTLTSQGTWHSVKGRNGQWDLWLWKSILYKYDQNREFNRCSTSVYIIRLFSADLNC